MTDPANIVKDLLESGENEVVEFKSAASSFGVEEIGKYFSALSNEANLGGKDNAWLCFGVDDKHNFINTRFRQDNGKLQKLKIEINQRMEPRITFRKIHAFEIEPGKRVILFQVPPAPSGMPVAFNGHYYAREHDATIGLSMDKIERIRNQVEKPDWSKSICEGATLDDLDPKAIEKARDLYAASNPRLVEQVNDWSDERFLNKAKITIRSKITNTTVVLLGKPESGHFISPAVSRISWILKSGDGSELDYEHFDSPMILSINKIYSKIRNIKYRYMQEGSLFPEETQSYDPYVIREALNNCIAHQDYSLRGRIMVVENQEDSLIFVNLGSFLPGSVENVINADTPSAFYRNKFLADAMVSLKMIDTIGGGIKQMFNSQRDRLFPMPEYDLTKNQVKVTVAGKILDPNYARKLAQRPDLDLNTIILLDKVQKGGPLSENEAKLLRSKGLIEGKRPNIYISSGVATTTDQRARYMKMRGVSDKFYKEMIIDYLGEYKSGRRNDFDDMLIEKLPDILSKDQKRNKITNILQSMKREGLIKISEGKTWVLN